MQPYIEITIISSSKAARC